MLNFTTPEVPEAFQDDYNEKKKYYDDRGETRQYYHAVNGQQSMSPLSPLSPHNNEISPPLGTFKRQKCLRLKARGRYSVSPREEDEDDRSRPILRSKSDISDRYWNRGAGGVPMVDPRTSLLARGKSESMSELEKFFDRLGLDDANFEQFIVPKSKSNYSSDNDSDNSAKFFSDVSTVDSTRLPDSTEAPSNPSLYRPSEPPSIIERNARIIKWLCNIKKTQNQQLV